MRFLIPVNGRNHHCELPVHGKRGKSAVPAGTAKTASWSRRDLAIGKQRFPTEITLTDRTDMGVPMLLGRAAIRGKFLVHPGRSFLISRKKRKTK